MCVKAVTKVHRGSCDQGLACFSQHHPRGLRKSDKDLSAETRMVIESQDGNTVIREWSTTESSFKPALFYPTTELYSHAEQTIISHGGDV